MTEFNNDTIHNCDKCNEMFPTIIHTCPCGKELARTRGHSYTHPYRSFCFECWQELDEKSWKYDQLNK